MNYSPHLKNGQDVLVAAHGNSLRALVMKLDDLSSEEVIQMEISTGKPFTMRQMEKVLENKSVIL